MMKSASLLLCLVAAGMTGCAGEPTATNVATPATSDDASYCFVGMD